MIHYVQSAFNSAMNASTELSQSQWILLSAAVIGIGFFALRGFTDRI